MKKNTIKLLLNGLLLTLLLSLAACKGLTEKTVSGKDGVTAVAGFSWQQIVGEEGLKELYDSSEADVNKIMLALGKDGGREGYLVVEEVFPQTTVNELKTYYMSYANKADQLDKAIQEMKAYDLTDREIEQITPIIKGETLTAEQARYLDQETVLQSYMYNIAKDSALNVKQEQIVDLTINGQKVQFVDYVYTNAQMTKVRQIEGYAQIGERFYLLSVWENESEFMANKEDYIKILESIKIEPAVTSVESSKAA